MRSRAYRRHQKENARNHARKVFHDATWLSEEQREKTAIKLANNLKTCQHVCCCNPRRHLHEVTRSEKKALLAKREQLQELD